MTRIPNLTASVFGSDALTPAQRVLFQAMLAIIAVMPVCALALSMDTRLLNDINVWIKPMKFQASVALHLVTLVVLMHCVADRWRGGWTLRAMAMICAAAGLFEILYISMQASRGLASHFNVTSQQAALLYSLMGVGAVTLVATSALVGWLILRAPRPGIGAGLKWGSGLGLIVGSAATLVVAGYLSQLNGHLVGSATPSDAGGMLLTGWSMRAGDLRVSHFFATHMMQVLPLVGWLADRHSRRPVTIVMAATLGGVLVVTLTFIQAVSGQPLL